VDTNNILLSKIVANPTDSTWAQAYSTLNLYIVLSLKSEQPKESIVSEGKELLERIQREYFSLDEKTLENIKKSIESASSQIEDKNSISIVLATITDDILYIIIAGHGSVVLKRGGKIGTIAKEGDGQISAFSGNLQNNDVVILETEAFEKKVPVSKLTSILSGGSAAEVSENLAPLVHEEAMGSEAAIILQYRNASHKIEKAEEPEAEEEDKIPQDEKSTEEIEQQEDFAEDKKNPINLKFPSFIGQFRHLGTKKIIIITIVILVLIFFGSMYFERQRAENAKRQSALTEILDPSQRRFNEAIALAKLNRGLALEEFNNIKSELLAKQDSFEKGTDQRKSLEEFIGKIEEEIGKISAGSTLSNQKLIFDKNVKFTVFREGRLLAIGSDGKISHINSDGEVEKEYDSKNDGVLAVAADENNIFILGDLGITQTPNSGSTKTIVEDATGTKSIDIFGANVYGLSDTIDKYSGSGYSRSDYFKDEVNLKNP
jgi:hypothetical protein